MPERKGLNLDAERNARNERKAAGKGVSKKPAPKTTTDAEKLKAKQRASLLEDDDEEDDEDDDLLDGLENKSGGKSKYLYAVAAVGLVVVLIIGFLVLHGSRKQKQNDDTPSTPSVSSQEPTPAVEDTQSGPVTPSGVGTQDFTGNTNMSNSEILTNPDMYIQDLYGLTTRVDYTVHSITSVADFVQYTKHRGTWGGGLELYWLDARYKDHQYSIQVPFQYYKELDDVGIVPVKMEVLTIEGSVAGEYLTVISYMQLDETVLKNVLKAQAK